MGDVLEIIGLEKKFEKNSLMDINITLHRGEILGIVGENGAGKTTVIKIILNMMNKTSGEVKILGLDHQNDEVIIKQKIGYVPAEDYFIPNATLRKHAETFKIFYECWDQVLFEELCINWRLPLNMVMSKYSTGMKTKAMLALALAHKPQLLILDEPTSGLDPIARIEVLEILQHFVSDGRRAVLFTTHIAGDLEKIADYIIIMQKGKVIEHLRLNEIKEKYVLVKGEVSKLAGVQEKLIGQKNDGINLEGLMIKNLSKEIDNKYLYEPDIETLLSHILWGEENEKMAKTIKGI